jgi:hypothetical protein
MSLLTAAAQDSTGYLTPGFNVNSLLSYLFKKGLLRGNTSQEEKYYHEPIFRPSIFREYLATDKIPDAPPSDFVTLSHAQIKSVFGISDAEIESFQTKVNGTSVFSIEQSSSYPYIYRVNNMLMIPASNNPTHTFNGVSTKNRVNLLASTIPFTFSNGAFRGKFIRTDGTGELSNRGLDIVFSQYLAFIYDYELGIFAMHDDDKNARTKNPIGATKPPAVTCYLYKGSFGRLGWSLKNDAIVLDETRLLIGKSETNDPTLVMDVSGSAFIDDIIVNSMSTRSDARLKENILISPTHHGILDLEPRYYNYIAGSKTREYGLIAQEVERVLPELVRTQNDTKSVIYDRIGVALLPIVKSQQERIASLEREIDDLKILLSTFIRKL